MTSLHKTFNFEAVCVFVSLFHGKDLWNLQILFIEVRFFKYTLTLEYIWCLSSWEIDGYMQGGIVFPNFNIDACSQYTAITSSLNVQGPKLSWLFPPIIPAAEQNTLWLDETVALILGTELTISE